MLRTFFLLEGVLVLLLFALAACALLGSLIAVVAHLIFSNADWPAAFGNDLLGVGKGISECWIAVLCFSAVLFYAPLRKFLENLRKAGPLESQPVEPTKETEISWGGKR